MSTTETSTRLELRTQDGIRITAQYDLIPGSPGLNEEQNITRNNDGEYELQWDDLSTSMFWDASEPERCYGETLYQDENGKTHLAGNLIIAEITTDDGNERITGATPYTGGIELPITYPLNSALDRFAIAQKYALWVTGAAQEYAIGAMNAATRDRIHNRARDYATQARVQGLVERILSLLQTA